MSSATLLIAHAGHWFVGVAYVAPVVLFAGWVGWVTLRDRRAAADQGPPKSGAAKGRRGPGR